MENKIVFEPQFRLHSLTGAGRKVQFRNYPKYYIASFNNGSFVVHESKKKFRTASLAFDYAQKVLARYKRLIAVAELAFITDETSPKLDPDYLNVIRNADDVRGEAVG